MTSEERFLEWWDKMPSTMISRKDQTYKAWLEATRQAYEEVLRICDEHEPERVTNQTENQVLFVLEAIEQTIQARLKELIP